MTNYLSMKEFTWLSAIVCLLTNTLQAQTPTAKRTTATTQPSSTSVVSNRQQELYDQYHGYNKKAVATSTTTTAEAPPADKPAVKQRPAERVVTTSSAKADASTTDTNERTSKKTKNQPTSQSLATARMDAPRRPESIEGNPSSRFRIGIRGGVTYPFYLEKVAYVDPVPGFVGGVTFTLGTGAVSFQPEVNYVRNSDKLTFLNVTTTEAVDFIQVPLLLKFSSGSYTGTRFFFNVGPYASYALSASIDGKKYSLDNTPGRFSFGAAAGIGAAIKAGPGHVTLEVRGLYPLGNTDNGFSADSKTIFGQGTIGYMFPLGGVR